MNRKEIRAKIAKLEAQQPRNVAEFEQREAEIRKLLEELDK